MMTKRQQCFYENVGNDSQSRTYAMLDRTGVVRAGDEARAGRVSRWDGALRHAALHVAQVAAAGSSRVVTANTGTAHL